MNPMLQCKTTILPLFIAGVLACFGLLPKALAVVPAPDGGYLGNNTAEGQNALLSLTTGINNTAVGWFSLKSNTDGQLNTAVGVGTLFSTVHASRNTAVGGAALFSDTGGSRNTAVGTLALFSNTTGSENTAIGDSALHNNTVGIENTANGQSALGGNTTGAGNTASGWFALGGNSTGNNNTAFGNEALILNILGSSNTGVGAAALHAPAGNSNTALGFQAGYDIVLSNNIDIGANVVGGAGDSNTIRIGDANITDTFIAGISGTTVASGAAVFVNSSGHLGTVTSSKRFKEEIRSMNKTSEAIFSLQPVTFRYRKEIDPAGTSQFGLIAEQVAKVNPTLVLSDKEGKPYTVRYDAVNAMLLNEFLKEHKAFLEEHGTVEELKKQVAVLTAGLQKVNAQLAAASPSRGGLEANKPAPQVVNNP